MGYYTNYTLTWKATNEAVVEFNRCSHSVPDSAKFCQECGAQNLAVALEDKIAEYIKAQDEMSYALNEDGTGREASKWYDHEKDMREMSNVFSGVVFTLHGEGEETGDIWNEYFLNGKCQVEKAKVLIADFDAKKLK